MNLYIIVDSNNAIRAWEGTQADAKRTAKEYDGEVIAVEVGVSKPDVLALLNKLVMGHDRKAGE